jgi:hypothetical protein
MKGGRNRCGILTKLNCVPKGTHQDNARTDMKA